MSDTMHAPDDKTAQNPGGPGTPRAPVGILAGGGRLPLDVADAILADGCGVHVIAIRGEAGPEVERFQHGWINWGAIGAMLRGFRSAGCRDIVIAGSVRRPDIRRLRPDIGFFTALPAVLALFNGGDDSALTKIVRFFEGQGFVIRGAHEFVPHLLAATGAHGTLKPSAAQGRAIEKAAAFINALGPFDVGQAAVATPDAILAVEAAGGTDAMLDAIIKQQAAGPAHEKHKAERANAVLVKLPKPGQELRVDMPAIGPATAERARKARLCGIAVAAGQTFLLAREELLACAETAELFVVGLDRSTTMASPAGGPRPARNPNRCGTKLAALGRMKPSTGGWSDIELGMDLVAVLDAHGAGRAVVIARQHVLGVQGAEPIADMVAMAARSRPWGRLMRRRRGVLVLRDELAAGSMASHREPLLDAASTAGLAGIACLEHIVDVPEAVAATERSGLFLVGPRRHK